MASQELEGGLPSSCSVLQEQLLAVGVQGQLLRPFRDFVEITTGSLRHRDCPGQRTSTGSADDAGGSAMNAHG
jgi:hypothetical protein